MTVRDAVGAVIYEEDYVRDLAKGRDHIVRVIRVLDDEAKVLLATGVTTKANRVEVVL